MSKKSVDKSPTHFVYSSRAMRQDASGAMRADIVLGLIEAITNADDAYGAASGKILIKVSAKDVFGHWTVSVSDRACGISSSDVVRKLITAGERTSGYERGERKRGNRGRGAKDLAIFGGVKFESVCGIDAIVLAADRNGSITENRELKATDDFRKSIGVTKNGTRVTISCRKNIVRKQFDVLKRQLQNAVALRQIMSNPLRTVILSYPDREETLRFVEPKAIETVFSGSVEVAGYGEAHLTLSVATEPFKEAADVDRLGGIVIQSGSACHESTLFGSENHPYADKLFGFLAFDAIDDLTRELDDLEERDEDPPDTNPFPIISRIRNGLEKTHPAYKALRAAVRPIIDSYLKRAADSAGATARETSDTRRRNELTARELAKWAIEQEQEIDNLIDDPALPRPPFEVIPSKRILEHGQKAAFTLRASADVVSVNSATVEIEIDEDPVGTLSSVPAAVTLSRPSEDADYYEAHLKICAGKVTGSVLIAAKLLLEGRSSGHDAEIVVSVVEPVEAPLIEPPHDFEFASGEYSVGPSKSRRLLLLAPADLVKRMGTDIIVSCSDQRAVLLRGNRLMLERVAEGWYEADVSVEGIQHGGEAIISATTPDKLHHATTRVVVRDRRGPQLEIKIEDIPGAQRAVWEESKEMILVRVNATHPAARRYFGPPPEFRLQQTTAARMMIAEAVADVAVHQTLKKQTEKMPAGALDIDGLQAERVRKLNDLLPRLHRAQISDAQWDKENRAPEVEPQSEETISA